MFSVYLQQECKPKSKAVSASSWYRCSNLAHSKDTLLGLPLPFITFFFTTQLPFYRFSPKPAFATIQTKYTKWFTEQIELGKMGGGGEMLFFFTQQGAVAQWLRCCATNRKIAGSIPGGVIGIFHWHNPSDRIMALGSTQPLTEMSTRSIYWG